MPTDPLSGIYANVLWCRDERPRHAFCAARINDILFYIRNASLSLKRLSVFFCFFFLLFFYHYNYVTRKCLMVSLKMTNKPSTLQHIIYDFHKSPCPPLYNVYAKPSDEFRLLFAILTLSNILVCVLVRLLIFDKSYWSFLWMQKSRVVFFYFLFYFNFFV